MDATLERLERLAALHRGGALSDAEYEAQKARVLAEEHGAGERVGRAPPAAFTPISGAELSRTWQRRFAFFREHGSPLIEEGAKALQQLPFWTASSIRFNIWGFLLGPVYFFALGLWRRGVSMFGVAAVISIVTQHLFGRDGLTLAGPAEAALFALSANYAYFIKCTQGRDEWNPLADLFDRSGGARPAVERPL